MDPVTLFLISQGIGAAINLGKAAHQAHKANKLAKTERPNYEPPQAAKDALMNAKFMASQTELPGQTIMEEKLNQSTSGAISNLKDVSSSGAALGNNIANIYRSNVNGQNQIGLAAAQNYNNNQANYRNQLNNMAGYEQYQFDYNQNQPYQNNMAASSALREGAFRNLSAAGSDIASGVNGYANMKYWNNQLNQDQAPTMDFGMTGGVKGKTGLVNEMSRSSVGIDGALRTSTPINTNTMSEDEMKLFEESLRRINNPNYDYVN